MSTELVDSITSLIENGKGDSRRLQYIIEAIKQGKKFYDTDRKYVGSLLETISNQSETISIQNEIKSIHNQIKSIQNHIKSYQIQSNQNEIKSIQNEIKSYQIKSNQNEIKSNQNEIKSIQNKIKSYQIKPNQNEIESIQNQIKSYQIQSNQNEIKLQNIEEDHIDLSYPPADRGEISKILDIIQQQNDDDPLTILKKRLAKGEITKEEYQDLKSALE